MITEKGAKAPNSNAERQSAYRARKADNKLYEVRGIFAAREDHIKIRGFLKTINFKGENHENS